MTTALLSAHSGGTDKYGGHRDIKTGAYHYHNAGTAHDPNNPYQDHTKCGVCADSLHGQTQNIMVGGSGKADSHGSENSLPKKIAIWLQFNPWAVIILAVITFLGLPLGIIFYLKTRRIKGPCFSIKSFNLVRDFSGKLNALQLTYAGEAVSNLTATKVAFWNKGKDTIHREDIADAEKLRIVCKDPNKVLDAKVLNANNAANQFHIQVAGDRKSVLLTFDYLDFREGAVIQILHTGISSQDLELNGFIKGAGKPKLMSSDAYDANRRRRSKHFKPGRELVYGLGMAVLMSVVFIGTLFMKEPEVAPGNPPPDFPLIWFKILLGIFTPLVWVGVIVGFVQRTPKGLEIYEQDI